MQWSHVQCIAIDNCGRFHYCITHIARPYNVWRYFQRLGLYLYTNYSVYCGKVSYKLAFMAYGIPFVKLTRILFTSPSLNKKCGRRVRPTWYAPAGLKWHRYRIGPRRLRLIAWPCDLDLWPRRSRRLWLMRVVVLHPCTKFEVRRPCRSEDMAHDVSK